MPHFAPPRATGREHGWSPRPPPDRDSPAVPCRNPLLELRAGHTLEQIQEEVTLDDVRKICPVWTPASLDEDWRQSVKTLVERSFRGVRGQG
ncbi:MAG: hypothetical protein EHM78_01455 [Myxococcaceae bacterium]|nr:MAG: hypothetical protein EHM78_01455 [Myxococcaceae bacterium]